MRSDSTMSADGSRPFKTYTGEDGQQLSLDATSSAVPSAADNEMNSISEEKLAHTKLCVDVNAGAESTTPNFEYSTMAFTGASDSQPVQPGETGSGSDNEDTVVSYSTMAFNKPGVDSSEVTVNYSTMAFNAETSSIESEDTVQYSSMGFPNHAMENDNSVQHSTMGSPTIENSANDSNEPSVSYSSMTFSNTAASDSEREDNSVHSNSTSTSSLNSSGANNSINDPVQYATIVSTASKNTPNAAMAFNSMPRKPSTGLMENGANNQSSTFPRKTTPSIEMTRLGTKVNYTSEPFKHSPISNRRLYPESRKCSNKGDNSL